MEMAGASFMAAYLLAQERQRVKLDPRSMVLNQAQVHPHNLAINKLIEPVKTSLLIWPLNSDGEPAALSPALTGITSLNRIQRQAEGAGDAESGSHSPAEPHRYSNFYMHRKFDDRPCQPNSPPIIRPPHTKPTRCLLLLTLKRPFQALKRPAPNKAHGKDNITARVLVFA